MVKKQRLLGVGAALASPAYFLLLRPRLLNWGASAKEQRRPLPGDGLTPCPVFQGTRALTVNAPVAYVWPWLAQLGQDRAGLYTPPLLERLLGAGTVNVDWIIPRFQEVDAGATLWLASPQRFEKRAYAVVAAVDPPCSLVLVTQPWTRLRRRADFATCDMCGSWAFVLEPQNASQTRLLVRRRSGRRQTPGEIVAHLFMEPVHLFLEWQMLYTIRRNAEARARRLQP